MDLSDWLTLSSICLLGAMSPGPSLAVMLSCTLSQSSENPTGDGYAAALSHGLGAGLYGLLTVVGLATVITKTPALYTAIQVAGALYLLYLGAKSLRSSVSLASDSTDSEDVNVELLANESTAQATANSGMKSAAIQGFLVAALNPKLCVFMLALFSQFLQPGYGAMEKGVMVATVGIIDATWYCAVVTLVSRPGFRRWFQSGSVVIDRIFGVIIIALALSVLYAALIL